MSLLALCLAGMLAVPGAVAPGYALSPPPGALLPPPLGGRAVGSGGGQEGGSLAAKVDELARALDGCGPGTDDDEVAAYLEALGAIGPQAAAAVPAILRRLPERSPLYRERDKLETVRLRGFLLATLARIRMPEEALPFILGDLSGSAMAYPFAAAARAAAALGPKARAAVPFLTRPLVPGFHDDLVSLERYDPVFPPEEGTTAAIEAVRALARMGPAAAPAVRVLEVAAAQPPGTGWSAALGEEARRALAVIRGQR